MCTQSIHCTLLACIAYTTHKLDSSPSTFFFLRLQRVTYGSSQMPPPMETRLFARKFLIWWHFYDLMWNSAAFVAHLNETFTQVDWGLMFLQTTEHRLMSHNFKTTDSWKKWHYSAMQYSAGKPGIQTFIWMPLDKFVTAQEQPVKHEVLQVSTYSQNSPDPNLIDLHGPCSPIDAIKQNHHHEGVYFVCNNVWVGFMGKGTSTGIPRPRVFY